MATTFSENYQIKLIGDGEEASTWGASTNKNLQIIEQMAGGGSSINVVFPNNASEWDSGGAGGGVLTWNTSDSAGAGATNSEGRSRFVTFTDEGIALGGTVTVEIRGNADDEYPERVFFVKNGLTDETLTLNGGSGTNYVVSNGAYAVVYCSGGSGGDVESVLNDLQVGSLNFEVAAATIQIKDNTAAALDITEGTNSYITIDTLDSSTGRRVIIGSENTDLEEFTINTDLVDLSTQPTELKLKTAESLSLKITDGTDNAIVVDTGNNKVIIGDADGFTTLDLDVDTIDSTDEAITWSIHQNDGNSLLISDVAAGSGSTDYIRCKTGTGAANQALYIGDKDVPTFLPSNNIWMNEDPTGGGGSDKNQYIRMPSGKQGAINVVGSSGIADEYVTINTDSQRIEISRPLYGKEATNWDVTDQIEIQNGLNVSSGTLTSGTVDINGGAIDGTVIGANVAAAITGTAITSTTGDVKIEANNVSVTMEDAAGTDADCLTLNASDKIVVGEATSVNGVELKSSADSFVVDYGSGGKDILHRGTSGTVYKADGTTPGVDSASATLGSNKQGGFAVGEMYFYFDTEDVAASGLAVDLSGSFSVIYTVLVTGGEAASGNMTGSVDASTVTTINLDHNASGNKLISYLAIGKS